MSDSDGEWETPATPARAIFLSIIFYASLATNVNSFTLT